MSRKSRKRKKNRGGRPTANDALRQAEAIQSSIDEAKVATSPLKQQQINVSSQIVHPVQIYHDGKWMTVDKNDYDFPYPLKQSITPEWAYNVLAYRNTTNRKIDKRRKKRYANAIINGEWAEINNGIGFYEDGSLADGQHRLAAIVDAWQTVPCIVVFGMQKSQIDAIDEGRPRSDLDTLRARGDSATKGFTSAAAYILEYKERKHTATKRERLNFAERHREAIEFVTTRLTRKGIARGPVWAACVRAYYHMERDDLQRFLELLQDCMMQEKRDYIVFQLRNFLLETKDQNTGPKRKEKYEKTERALVCFMNGETRQRLHAVNKEQFPLPEEELAES